MMGSGNVTIKWHVLVELTYTGPFNLTKVQMNIKSSIGNLTSTFDIEGKIFKKILKIYLK